MNDVLALRPRLFGIAYRILGSIAEAEDVVQSAYVRLEEHRDEELRNPGGWLATVTSRLAIDRARVLARERETYVGVWLPEPLLAEADDPAAQTARADDLAIGFLRVLERLQPEERTAMLLHDVFAYSHGEIAQILSKSEEAVRQMTARARSRVRAERPRFAVDREKAASLTERFLRALRDANVDELRAVLATDVVAMADGGGKVNAGIRPVLGIDNVSRLLIGVQSKYWRHGRMERLSVNGDPGAGLFADDVLSGVLAFDFADDRIASIYVVVNPDKLGRPNPS